MPEAARLHTESLQEWVTSTARLMKGHSAVAGRTLATIMLVTMAGLSEAG
jgi:hypothetical protein